MSIETDTNDFNDWFKHLLHLQSSCFERDVLRDCKPQLRERYLLRCSTWPDDPKEDKES